MRLHERQQGFTITEILVAILLLSILIVTVLGPMTGLFGLTRQTTNRTAASTTAQSVMEQIKGEWQNSPKYQMACISTASLPSGATVILQDLNANFNIQGTSYSVATSGSSCGATPAVPDISASSRKVTVSVTQSGTTSTLTMEIAHP